MLLINFVIDLLYGMDKKKSSLTDLIEHLEDSYTKYIGYEFMHIEVSIIAFTKIHVKWSLARTRTKEIGSQAMRKLIRQN